MSFSYELDYLNASKALPLSRHLPPIGATAFDDAVSRAFFENLLPEANVRIQVGRTLGISPENIFGLLSELGGDCAGAVRLLPDGTDPHKTGRYRLISEEELAAALAKLPDHPFWADEEWVRLSLAGRKTSYRYAMTVQIFTFLEGRRHQRIFSKRRLTGWKTPWLTKLFA